MFARMLRCVSITPFGTPVLPLEKITVASVVAVGRRDEEPLEQRGGQQRARAASIAAFARPTSNAKQIFEEHHAVASARCRPSRGRSAT